MNCAKEFVKECAAEAPIDYGEIVRRVVGSVEKRYRMLSLVINLVYRGAGN